VKKGIYKRLQDSVISTNLFSNLPHLHSKSRVSPFTGPALPGSVTLKARDLQPDVIYIILALYIKENILIWHNNSKKTLEREDAVRHKSWETASRIKKNVYII